MAIRREMVKAETDAGAAPLPPETSNKPVFQHYSVKNYTEQNRTEQNRTFIWQVQTLYVVINLQCYTTNRVTYNQATFIWNSIIRNPRNPDTFFSGTKNLYVNISRIYVNMYVKPEIRVSGTGQSFWEQNHVKPRLSVLELC